MKTTQRIPGSVCPEITVEWAVRPDGTLTIYIDDQVSPFWLILDIPPSELGAIDSHRRAVAEASNNPQQQEPM